MTMIEPETTELVMGWQGPITAFDVWAGELDRRMWHTAEWPDLPRSMGSSHSSDETVGTVDELEILTSADGVRYLWGRGRFSDTDEGRKAAMQVAEGSLRTVSIEVRDGDFTDWPLLDDEGEIVGFATEWDRIVISAFALERNPAFAGCVIVPDGEAAAFVYAPPAEPNPGDSALPDDGERPEAEPLDSDEVFAEMTEALAIATPATTPAIVASMVDAPPADWFTAPDLPAPTPLTLDGDGRLVGHLALWDTCHTSFPDACVCAPKSSHDYAYFMTGCVRCADGETMATGPLTLGTDHAPITADARAATAHYDHTGAAVADVAVGEDGHGIWCSGRIRPGASDGQVEALLASSPSGDWRPIGGGLELVAVLAVNAPGFPVPRARVASGERLALIASGGAPPVAVLARRRRGGQRGPMPSALAKIAAQDAEIRGLRADLDRVLSLLDEPMRDAARVRLTARPAARAVTPDMFPQLSRSRG